MQISGIIEVINNEVQVSEKFKKREFVIDAKEDNSPYENFIKFELVQDKCDLIDTFKVGDKINVDFNINGRKWTNPQGEEVYFNSIKAWRISPVSNAEAAPQSPPTAAHQTPPPASTAEPEWLKDSSKKDTSENNSTSDEDDLPF